MPQQLSFNARMTTAHQTLTEAATKARRFKTEATPETAVPCLECAAPIDRAAVTHPRFMLCRKSCARRFTARMKADGLDPAKMAERAFRDVFSISRGTLAGQRQALPLLPDPDALLLYMTRTLRRVEPYREARPLFSNCW